MMDSFSAANKPHAVCIPRPYQGHINPMFKLAKLLHYKGFHITFVHTEYSYKRLLQSRGPNSVAGLPDFRFETIPDGLDADATRDVRSLCESMSKNCLVPFCNLLGKLNENSPSSGIPPVTCIVSDGVMSFTLKASEELGVAHVLFWTTSACGFLAYTQFQNLVDRGLTPLKDESYLTNGYLETTIDWIPGMKNIRLRDLPTFIRTTDPNDLFVHFAIQEVGRAQKGSAIILNTFDALEEQVLNSLSSMFSPPIYTIGPLQLMLNQIPPNNLEPMDSNLWKEDVECLQWLDSKEPNSVVYVNFGSITVMTPEQLVEFGWGLANSNQSFLWIIRPNLVVGESPVLPPEFVDETKDRGLMASWCPQGQVLSHSSIVGFLTHSGWNSTIESISSGVPMICWPFFAEQQTNCRYACSEWGIGMEIDNNVKRDEVEKLVRELVDGEKGKEMKNKVLHWKKMAEAAAGCNGSSRLNIDKLVEEVLRRK